MNANPDRWIRGSSAGETDAGVSVRIALLAAGTRGDVQPFIGLARGLIDAGHEARLATDARYAMLAASHAVPFVPLRASGHAPVTPAGWRALDRTAHDIGGTDALVYHRRVGAALHLAKRLRIPSIAASPVPALAIRVAGAVPGGRARRWSAMLERIVPRLRGRIAPALSRLPAIGGRLRRLKEASPRPVLYCVSRHVVRSRAARPAAIVTGYWFVDRPERWAPPAALEAFLAAGAPPVYVDFGDTRPHDPDRLALIAMDALRRAGLRGILARGVSSLAPGRSRLPANVHLVDDVPHDWLLPRVAGAVVHGGAGTTAAVLRAGKPMVVCPFVAVQRFWARRVSALGVALPPIAPGRLDPIVLGAAMRRIVRDDLTRARARGLGARIRQEEGIRRAVSFLEEAVPAARRGRSPAR
jgi:sterol 3beta-glucosyltransferase